MGGRRYLDSRQTAVEAAARTASGDGMSLRWVGHCHADNYRTAPCSTCFRGLVLVSNIGVFGAYFGDKLQLFRVL